MPRKRRLKSSVIVFLALLVFAQFAGAYVLLCHLYSNYAFIPLTVVCSAEQDGDKTQVQELFAQLTMEFQQAYIEHLWAVLPQYHAGSVRIDADRRLLLLTAQDWFGIRDSSATASQLIAQVANNSVMVAAGFERMLTDRHGLIDRQDLEELYDLPEAATQCDVLKEFVLVGGKYAGDEKPLAGWALPDWYMKYFALDKRHAEGSENLRWWFSVATALFDPDEPYDPEREKNKPHPGVPEIIPEAEDAP